MNAVIVELRKKQAAALDETGRVVRIPDANYEIGQTIELHEVKPVRTPTMLKRFGAGAAAAVVLAALGTGTAYAVPSGTVTLESGSAIEYTINCFDYVLDVQAANEEGETLLAEMDAGQLRHRRLDDALSAAVGLLTQESGGEAPKLCIETRNEEHTERLRGELSQILERAGGSRSPEAADWEAAAPDAPVRLPEELVGEEKRGALRPDSPAETGTERADPLPSEFEARSGFDAPSGQEAPPFRAEAEAPDRVGGETPPPDADSPLFPAGPTADAAE